MIARVGKKNKVKAKKSGFKYQKRSAESVKKRADQTGGNFDSPVKAGIDMWRPKSGENVIRILPATWEDFDHYGLDVYMHRFIGSDSSNYLCLNKMKGKRCPACIEQKAAKDGGEDEEAKQLAYAKRCWVWIIDRDDKTETPQIWDMSWAQDRDIAGLSHFKSGKVLLIDHPDDGYDIIVKKSGSGLKTKYHFNIERDSSPISDDEDKQEEILNYIQENPIPTVLHFFSAEHIEKKLEGTTEERDEDLDDEDEENEGRGKKRKAGKRSRDEDEDEDEDEAPKKKKKKKPVEEEDEEEEETPRRRRKKKPEPDDDEEEEDEEEEDEEDEEDEEPAPKKKKKRKPVEEDDEDEEDERAPKKKKKKPDPEDEDEEDEEDEDEDEDEEDEEEEEERRPVKKKKKARR